MRLVRAGRVQQLTGLSANQLRDWARRGLIVPDLRPTGSGSRAGYSWQTVLLLRLAVVLKSFHVELQAQRNLFQDLSQRLAKTSFPALRGLALVVGSQGDFDLVSVESVASVRGNFLILRLDEHLGVLSTGFGIVDSTDQLSLFPAVAVR